MSVITDLKVKHVAKYTKRSLGKTPIRPQRTVCGYSVVCSCGWTIRTNEDKTKVVEMFRKHKLENK